MPLPVRQGSQGQTGANADMKVHCMVALDAGNEAFVVGLWQICMQSIDLVPEQYEGKGVEEVYKKRDGDEKEEEEKAWLEQKKSDTARA